MVSTPELSLPELRLFAISGQLDQKTASLLIAATASLQVCLLGLAAVGVCEAIVAVANF